MRQQLAQIAARARRRANDRRAVAVSVTNGGSGLPRPSPESWLSWTLRRIDRAAINRSWTSGTLIEYTTAPVHALLGDEPGPTQDGQLLREVAGFDIDGVEQLMDRVVAFAEQLQDADPGRVAEGPEELRLGLVQRANHASTLTHEGLRILTGQRGSPPQARVVTTSMTRPSRADCSAASMISRTWRACRPLAIGCTPSRTQSARCSIRTPRASSANRSAGAGKIS